MYVGNDKLMVTLKDIMYYFMQKRAIQELNYSSLKEIKILRTTLP